MRRRTSALAVIGILLLVLLIAGGGCGAQAPTRLSSLSVGSDQVCALFDHHVRCWGYNNAGQLGDGSRKDSWTPVRTRVRPPAAQVSAGWDYSCAVLVDGAVYCWGKDDRGQLGNGNKPKSAVPVRVPGIDNAVQVNAGFQHTCAVLATHRVKCWGSNEHGQLGDGKRTKNSGPVDVVGIRTAIKVVTGAVHTCVLLLNGRIDCWGDNDFGQVGSSSLADSSIPTRVSGIGNAVEISAGYNYVCALESTHRVKCWGDDEHGELGDGKSGLDVHSSIPVAAHRITNVTAISAGAGQTCALVSDHRVECWGVGGAGQVGNGTMTVDNPIPAPVKTVTDAAAISAGVAETCALLSDGRVECWGEVPSEKSFSLIPVLVDVTSGFG